MARIEAPIRTAVPAMFDLADFDLADVLGHATRLQAVDHGGAPVFGVALADVVKLEIPGQPGLWLWLNVEAAEFRSGWLSSGLVTSALLFTSGPDNRNLLQLRLTNLSVPVPDLLATLRSDDSADDALLLAYAMRGDDRIRLGSTADLAEAGAGDDTLWGGHGKDTLAGGQGNDRLDGGWDHDLLLGGNGADELRGGGGRDTLRGGGGADTFVFGTGAGRDTVADFKDGSDRIYVEGVGLSIDNLVVQWRGENVIIRLGDDDLLLLGVEPGRIGAEDFIFDPPGF